MNQSIKTHTHIVEFLEDFQNNMTGQAKLLLFLRIKQIGKYKFTTGI